VPIRACTATHVRVNVKKNCHNLSRVPLLDDDRVRFDRMNDPGVLIPKTMMKTLLVAFTSI